MATLLHIEELQHELDVRSYDMQGVCLEKAGAGFLSLEVGLYACVSQKGG